MSFKSNKNTKKNSILFAPPSTSSEAAPLVDSEDWSVPIVELTPAPAVVDEISSLSTPVSAYRSGDSTSLSSKSSKRKASSELHPVRAARSFLPTTIQQLDSPPPTNHIVSVLCHLVIAPGTPIAPRSPFQLIWTLMSIVPVLLQCGAYYFSFVRLLLVRVARNHLIRFQLIS